MSKKEIRYLNLRMPAELHARCKELADLEGVSLNTFILKTLSECDDGKELPKSAEERLIKRIERLEKAVFGTKK